MLRNYWMVAWRNLMRNRLHTSINIAGLSIGVSACLVIYLIVSFELSFNKQMPAYERIYRIHSSFSGVFSGVNRGVPTAVGPTVRDQFTGIEAVASANAFSGKVSIPQNGAAPKEGEIKTALILTEPSYFEVFSAYEWIAGSPAVLSKPFQLVLTEAAATRYFGSASAEQVIGREVIYRDSLSVTVAGIVKDLPFNTDIDFSEFMSLSTVEQSWLKKNIQLDNWNSVNSSSQVFLKLTEGTTREKIEAQMPLLSKLYKEKSEWDVTNNFQLQTLADIHYQAEIGIFDHSRAAAHMPTLLALIGVAILLLTIGAINFINLETAQSIRRAKEVGVRKVLGGTRSRLILQFLSESLVITLISMLLALPLTEFALQYFSEFIPEGVQLNLPGILPFMAAVMLIIGVLAGLYPAFILSSFLPALALKNQVHASNAGSRSAFLRRTLIVFQFTFAQLLIIGTLVVNSQVHYLLSKDLGFKADAILFFDAPWWENPEKAQALITRLQQIPEIEDISMSDAPPAYPGWSSSTVSYKSPRGGEVNTNGFRKFGDTNYLNFYNIELIAGRNIGKSDTVKEFVINETMLHTLGFQDPQEVIDQQITYNKQQYPIVGVVKDFHIQSLHKKVEPVIIANSEKEFTCFNIRIGSAGEDAAYVKNVISKIESAWKEVYADTKLEHHFLDETLKSFYETEERTAKLANTATGLAIFISCLGLFGLVSYTTVQRTKEIGIRKVMGASARNIVMLLSRDFIVLVVVAFVLASPLAWYAANQWLEGFAYQQPVSFLIFGATAVIAVALAFVTVSYKTWRAANANPVDALRTE